MGAPRGVEPAPGHTGPRRCSGPHRPRAESTGDAVHAYISVPQPLRPLSGLMGSPHTTSKTISQSPSIDTQRSHHSSCSHETPHPPGLLSHLTSLSCTPAPSPAPSGPSLANRGDNSHRRALNYPRDASALFPRQAQVYPTRTKPPSLALDGPMTVITILILIGEAEADSPVQGHTATRWRASLS